MAITADQIRAARALKNWSQADLAERVDMATPSIGNIESGKHNPTPQTQAAIIEAFEDAGIEFIDGGVRKKQDLVTIFEGDDCYLKLLDDVFRTLAKSKGEVLFSGSDETRSPPEVIEKLRAIRRSGIRMRSLVMENDTYLMGSLGEYRYMPKSVFVDSDVKVIFGDCIAYLVSWKDVWKVIILREPSISAEATRIFEFFWSVGQIPTTSTAEILYEEKTQ
ncbi:helix-turn-helix transcriptional regulator [Micavibrio aeruginosavorus]|uniref:HTH cro/C1-type domain-containing protein n=1 Tax=Micavibrio aeruginosavorus EPB TaxID=349215 RepID=M4VJV8_9BACT|nr:helix-turn-helix transcriptional regulator [Micavibrio aeruginosavorus]AGH98351.1 hypothetical protein A11S_1545 [Micavibrio aeruginosavorus EPB]